VEEAFVVLKHNDFATERVERRRSDRRGTLGVEGGEVVRVEEVVDGVRGVGVHEGGRRLLGVGEVGLGLGKGTLFLTEDRFGGRGGAQGFGSNGWRGRRGRQGKEGCRS
jgi:hypothetical protein